MNFQDHPSDGWQNVAYRPKERPFSVPGCFNILQGYAIPLLFFSFSLSETSDAKSSTLVSWLEMSAADISSLCHHKL